MWKGKSTSSQEALRKDKELKRERSPEKRRVWVTNRASPSPTGPQAGVIGDVLLQAVPSTLEGTNPKQRE